MNLIQIQEHLKDMPMRSVMDYANGSNPDVPPYLALSELNRRKRVQESAKTAQPPDGTVKERLEKELTGQATDLMQAGAARQAQSNEAMQQGIMAQPQPVPEGTPQPPQLEEEMPQMAGGGLTALPVNDMFRFAEGGGIIALSNGGESDDKKTKDEKSREQLKSDRAAIKPALDVLEKLAAAGYDVTTLPFRAAAGVIDSGVIRPARAISGAEIPYLGNIIDTSTATPAMDELQRAANAPPPPARIQPTFSPDDQSAAETARLARSKAPMGIANAAAQQNIPRPPTSGMPASGRLPTMPSFPTAPNITAPGAETYATELAKFKQANPGQAGSGFQALLEKIAKQDEEDRARFITQEKARSQSDFFQSLIAAGEATRGQKGIGALFAGYGRSSAASQKEADERENAQRKMRREQDLNIGKMSAEIEAARRAEARGDFEGAFKHRQEAEKIERDLKQTKYANEMETAKNQFDAQAKLAQLAEQARGNSIQAAAANRLPQLVQVAEDIQRKNPQMSPNEAMERAASYLASGQYQTAAQRQAKATFDALSERTKLIDQQLTMASPGSADEKKLKQQREAMVAQFLADQKRLSGQAGAPNVNTPSSGFGQASRV